MGGPLFLTTPSLPGLHKAEAERVIYRGGATFFERGDVKFSQPIVRIAVDREGRPRSVLLFAAVIESGELMRLEEKRGLRSKERSLKLSSSFRNDSQTPLTAEQTLCLTAEEKSNKIAG